MSKQLTPCELVERSIITKFRKGIWTKFLQAVKKYKLIEEGDKIAVCVSGGKDSMLLAKCVQELKKHSEISFDAEYIVMNPGYNEENLALIKQNLAFLEIPAQIFESDIFGVNELIGGEHPCYLCARMRRGFLYARAQELGCNKIALGHHMSDVIETTLMSMLFGGQIQGMMPKISSNNFKGMQLIRPLYCVLDDEIIRWQNYNNLKFIACACKLTENLSLGEQGQSARQDIKKLIKDFRARNPDVDASIFKSLHNVQLDTLPEFKYRGETYDFNSKYEKGIKIIRN
ncbi:MAG: tRNA 2-thiocytidine biosynthesis protein TtcA [Clostridiales bacterium]|nr:tRNA 2-thiocytidine biosynthesis protein TtcA [Clostridiales bacterium]